MNAEDIPSIVTERLELAPMSVRFMEALARGDVAAASEAIGAQTNAWLALQLENFLKFRLGQLALDPGIRIWLGRVMVLTGRSGERRVVGSIGFHGPPDDQRRLEVGYSVDPAHRRQGLAREAIAAMFDWANAEHGITTFVASISPDNEPSLRLADGFGFVRVGEQMDEIDGLEYVFETTWPRPLAP